MDVLIDTIDKFDVNAAISITACKLKIKFSSQMLKINVSLWSKCLIMHKIRLTIYGENRYWHSFVTNAFWYAFSLLKLFRYWCSLLTLFRYSRFFITIAFSLLSLFKLVPIVVTHVKELRSIKNVFFELYSCPGGKLTVSSIMFHQVFVMKLFPYTKCSNLMSHEMNFLF